ncbi:MAG: glycosyltransferase family 39 protein [Elusimicrobia bacterium]|nr:glycosyltransferase family 39 protein [Elusimicrobiota bacterium]
MHVKVISYLEKMLMSKALKYGIGIFMVVYFTISFLTLTKIPLHSRDEVWFSEVSYYFMQYGSFNSQMFQGLKEAVGGWVGHGAIFYIVDTISFHLIGTGLFQARLPVFLLSFVILFLVYKTAKKLYNQRTAVLSFIIVAISYIFFKSSHAFEAHIFLLFVQLLCLYLFVMLKENTANKFLPFLIGLLAMASLEIHWIGTIIPIAILILFIYEKRLSVLKDRQFYFFIFGCLVSFLVFIYYRIYVQGWNQFVYKYNLYYGLSEPSSYLKSLTEEIVRYRKYFATPYRVFELLPMFIAICYVLKRRTKSDFLLLILIITYIVLMALVVKNKNPYFILFFPFIYVLIASVIDNLLSNLKQLNTISKTSLLFIILIIPFFLCFDFRLIRQYWGADYSKYIKELKQYIPSHSSVMGPMPLWYGFYDQLYYDNLHYIERALERDTHYNDLKGTPDEVYMIKHLAFISFLKELKVEYFILDESSKEYLTTQKYMKFDDSEEKFMLITDVKNKHYVGYYFPKNKKYYITKIYRIKY